MAGADPTSYAAGIEDAARVAEERHTFWHSSEKHEVACDVSACEDIAAAIRTLAPERGGGSESAAPGSVNATLDRALRAMRGVTAFVTSKERINRPEGEEWWQEEIDALAALLGDRSFPEAADGRPTSDTEAELFGAGCDPKTARFVARQLEQKGLVLAAAPQPPVPAHATDALKAARSFIQAAVLGGSQRYGAIVSQIDAALSVPSGGLTYTEAANAYREPIARLNDENDRLALRIRELEGEVARLKADCDAYSKTMNVIATLPPTERDHLTTAAQAARDALEPFAMCEALFGEDWADTDEIAGEPFDAEDGGGNGALLFTIKVGQFRRAREALASLASVLGGAE